MTMEFKLSLFLSSIILLFEPICISADFTLSVYTDSHVVISIYKFGATCFCLKRQKLYLLKMTVSVVATYMERRYAVYSFICVYIYM